MLLSLIFASLIAIVTCGWGFALSRILKYKPGSFFESFLLGIFSLSFCLVLVNFFWPLKGQVVIAQSLLGILFFFRWKTKEIRLEKSFFLWAFALGSLLIVLPLPYDTGLYHLQAQLWWLETPLQRGLVHLQSRLAYNGLWSLFSAAFYWPLLEWDSVYLVNISLTSAFLSYAYRRENLRILFLPIFFLSLNSHTRYILYETQASTGNDWPITLATLFVTTELVKKNATAFGYWILLPLLKLSALPLAIFGILKRPKFINWALLFLCLWMARGFWLSGCAMYPLKETCMPSLSWATSKESANLETRANEAWAKHPFHNVDEVLGGWNWVGEYFWPQIGQWPYLKHFFIFFLMALFAAFVRGFLFRNQKYLSLTLIFSLGIWFLKGPDFRFAWGLWLSLLILITPFWVGKLPRVVLRLPLVYFLLQTLYIPVFHRERFPLSYYLSNFHVTRDKIQKETSSLQFKNIEHPRFGTVNLPTEGENCWAAPRPCTFEKALRH